MRSKSRTRRTTTTTAATITGATAARGGLSPKAGRLDPEAAGAYVGELFAEQGRMVLGLCRLLLRDPIEADDAAQQVFLSAHQAVLRGSTPRDPPAWLAAITRNECRARIRARMREPLALPDLPSDLPDPLVAAVRAADLQALWAALGTLPRRQRRALLLRELGGLSYHELGRALGVSHSAVESLLFRARRQVRSLVAGAAPVAVRDQLAQLIPGFDPASAGIVARAAALPIALKLAGAAVGVGVVASGAGGFHSASIATPPVTPRHVVVRVAPPALRVVQPLVRRHQRVVQRPAFRAPHHRGGDEAVEAEHPEPAEHAEQQQAPSVQTSSEGPGPAPAELAQVEPSDEGPGDGGGQTETIEEHSGSDHSGGEDGGSGHSGPG